MSPAADPDVANLLRWLYEAVPGTAALESSFRACGGEAARMMGLRPKVAWQEMPRAAGVFKPERTGPAYLKTEGAQRGTPY